MKFVDDNMNGKHFIFNTRKLIRTIIKNYFRFATASYTLKWETNGRPKTGKPVMTFGTAGRRNLQFTA